MPRPRRQADELEGQDIRVRDLPLLRARRCLRKGLPGLPRLHAFLRRAELRPHEDDVPARAPPRLDPVRVLPQAEGRAVARSELPVVPRRPARGAHLPRLRRLPPARQLAPRPVRPRLGGVPPQGQAFLYALQETATPTTSGRGCGASASRATGEIARQPTRAIRVTPRCRGTASTATGPGAGARSRSVVSRRFATIGWRTSGSTN